MREEEWPGQRQWRRLEAEDYRFGKLRIEVRNVYVGADLAWYQQLANTLHAETDPDAVRDLLTIRPGERVTAARVYEAERVLRRQPFFTDARILPTGCEGDRVAADVRVRDAWTLQLDVGFGSAGGESESSAGFQDENFLGTGKGVLLDWSDDSERTTLEFGYEDPSLFGTQWTLGLSHSELSDGRSDAVALGYPFRRSGQPWGFRAEVDDGRTELDFEADSRTAYEVEVESQEADIELRRLTSLDPDGGWRAGLGWQRDYADYGPLQERESGLRSPPRLTDRRLQGPYLSLERFSTRFRSFRNLRAIGKNEDYALGFRGRVAGGRYVDGASSDNPWFFDIDIDHGLPVGAQDLLLTRLDLSGRYRDDGGEEAWYRSAGADYYHRTSSHNTIVLHGEYDWRDDADPEDELYLGGFDGMLAYPDRFRVGDRRWLLHLENRYVSDTVLFDTIQVGYTGWLEAGNSRGLDGRWGEPLADAGVGLRLGSLRSSFGSVTYLTLGFPLVDTGEEDEYTIVAGTTVDF
ncbi:MAG: hypothetical protein ACOCP9_05270 [Halofilum sp. (in: g-proteobacteria)]